MSAYMYDELLLNKLKKWTENSDVHVYGVDETRTVFETIADESKKDANVKLPLITLSRKSGFNIINPNKTQLSYNGLPIKGNAKKAAKLNAVPIKLDYQLDIYAKYFKEADAIARELIFNIINYPTLKLVIPYHKVDYEHNSTIRLSENVSDNSNVPNVVNIGQFSRLSLDITIDDAYLFDVRIKNNVHIAGSSAIIGIKDENKIDFKEKW